LQIRILPATAPLTSRCFPVPARGRAPARSRFRQKPRTSFV